jgi:hypothetical protein
MEVGEKMTEAAFIAIISLIGTLGGTFGGILTSARLTNYRIEQLEKKVEQHNNFAQRIPVLEEKIKVEEHRIEDLEQFHKN